MPMSKSSWKLLTATIGLTTLTEPLWDSFNLLSLGVFLLLVGSATGITHALDRWEAHTHRRQLTNIMSFLQARMCTEPLYGTIQLFLDHNPEPRLPHTENYMLTNARLLADLYADHVDYRSHWSWP